MSKEAMKMALDNLIAEYYMENSSLAKRVDDIFKEALAEQPAQQCKCFICQSEEYQQALAEQIKRELVGEQPAQQQEPDLSGLKPETQKQMREWLADGSFVERVISALQDQERLLMAYEKAQPQEPVAWLVCENWRKHSLFFTKEGAEDFKNAAQREDDLSGNLARWKAKPLYTSPPAQPQPVFSFQMQLKPGWGNQLPSPCAIGDPDLRSLFGKIGDVVTFYTSPPAQRKPLPQTPPAYANINQRIAYKAGWRDAETAHGIKENT